MRFIASHLFFTLTWVTCSAESAQCAFIKNSSSLIMRASSSLHILPLLLPMKGIIRRSMGAINHHHCIEENCTLKTHHFNLLLLFQGLRHPTINVLSSQTVNLWISSVDHKLDSWPCLWTACEDLLTFQVTIKGLWTSNHSSFHIITPKVFSEKASISI